MAEAETAPAAERIEPVTLNTTTTTTTTTTTSTPSEFENQRRTLNIRLLSEAISSLILLSVRFQALPCIWIRLASGAMEGVPQLINSKC